MKFTWTRRTITTYAPEDPPPPSATSPQYGEVPPEPRKPPEPRGGPRPVETWTRSQVIAMVTGSILSMCAGGAMTALLVKWWTGQ